MMLGWLTRDWGLKSVALVLAVGLWYYAVSEEAVEVTRTVPLRIKVHNPQITVLKSSVNGVHVTLSAPRALLADLTSEKILAVHEMGEEVKTAGDYSFRLVPRDIELPSRQVRVVGIEPETIHVTLDELIVFKLAVMPEFVGEPAFGYRVATEEIQIDPSAILVEGPKGQLEKMDAVKTEKLDLVGRIRSFRRTVALDLPVNVKPMSEALIDVYVPIREESEERSYDKIPVRVLADPRSKRAVHVEPAEISFVLKGSVRHLERLIPETIMAYVDATSLEEGEHPVPVQLTLPEEVRLKGEAPLTVKVRVGKE